MCVYVCVCARVCVCVCACVVCVCLCASVFTCVCVFVFVHVNHCLKYSQVIESVCLHYSSIGDVCCGERWSLWSVASSLTGHLVFVPSLTIPVLLPHDQPCFLIFNNL